MPPAQDAATPSGVSLQAGFFLFFQRRGKTVHVLVQAGLVGLGGALGSLARWGVAVLFARLFGTAFPFGTFFINVSGSLFLGWFSTLLAERLVGDGNTWIHPDDLRLLIAVGFTGAYTTFSTFEYESVQLVQDGDGLKGLTYIFGSVFLGLVAVRLGILLARAGGASS
jgi:fluoride exporter